MKKILLYSLHILTFSVTTATSQTFPAFLHGTWKLENKETFEHWDLVDENILKGFSYQINKGKIDVTEYLEINKNENGIFYKATVLNQNQGIGIDFKLIQTDSLFSFENPGHDFPKFIRYRQVSETRMKVTVGTEESNFILNFHRVK